MPLLLQDSFLTSYTPKAMSQEPSSFHPLLLRLRTTPRWFSPLLLVDLLDLPTAAALHLHLLLAPAPTATGLRWI